MMDKHKLKAEFTPEMIELVRQNPDSILAERIRLYLRLQRMKADVLESFEDTILYPIVKWWLK